MSESFDALPDAVLVLDREWRIEAANAAAAEMLGWTPSELVGASAADLLKPRGDDGKGVWDDGWPAATRLSRVERIPEQLVYVRHRGGSDLQVAATGRYRRNGRGALGGVVLVLRPVRRRDRRTASGIEVVSTVSHELRAPLTSVKGFTSLMLNRWDRLDDDQKREMIHQVHVDADRVTRLVTELLDISRLETGHLRLRRQMVELPALVEKVVSDVRYLHPDLDPVIAMPENLPSVYADPDKIVQVLTNLVENTGKYAGARGVRVEAGADPDANQVRVRVLDAGPGIPERDLQRIFTKFYRSGEGRPTGSGLGLYIAKGIVEAHGGRLWAESAAGEGATFIFTLPSGIPEELTVGSTP